MLALKGLETPLKKLAHASDCTAACLAWTMPSRRQSPTPVPAHSLYICKKSGGDSTIARSRLAFCSYGAVLKARYHKPNLAVSPARP